MGSSASDSDDEDSDGFSFVTSSTFGTFSGLVSPSGSSSDSDSDDDDGFSFVRTFSDLVPTQKISLSFYLSPLQGFPLQAWVPLLQIQMMRILMAFPL